MRHKDEEYRQHRIQWAITSIPDSDQIKAKGSVSWTDFSGVFHLHPLLEIYSHREIVAEKQLVEQARNWIDNRLKP